MCLLDYLANGYDLSIGDDWNALRVGDEPFDLDKCFTTVVTIIYFWSP